MQKKALARYMRHRRIRMRITGSAQRPRLLVKRSLMNMTVTGIDDVNGKALFTVSTADKEIRQKMPSGGTIKAAEFLGEVCAKRMKEKGVGTIVFDRGGNLYHGRVKALAEALRKGNIVF
jgi:large subunit ribosomal protein L18